MDENFPQPPCYRKTSSRVKMNVVAVVSTTATAARFLCSRNHHRYSCFGFLFCWKRRKSMSGFSNFLPPSAAISTDSSAVTTETKPQAVPKPKQHQQWLIVGLGNPGWVFQGTRHNVGSEMLDAIAEANGISVTSVSFKALVGKGFIENVPVMLVKPQTFMNLSGESVGAIVSYYKIPLKQVLVIFDDLDLPFAKLRLLPKGGHGGQNGFSVVCVSGTISSSLGDMLLGLGKASVWVSMFKQKVFGPMLHELELRYASKMRSIIDHFNGSHDFPRLRIGIGRPLGKMGPVNFILQSFSKQEREELDFTFKRVVEAVRILLLEGFNKAATYVNSVKPVEQLG